MPTHVYARDCTPRYSVHYLTLSLLSRLFRSQAVAGFFEKEPHRPYIYPYCLILETAGKVNRLVSVRDLDPWTFALFN